MSSSPHAHPPPVAHPDQNIRVHSHPAEQQAFTASPAAITQTPQSRPASPSQGSTHSVPFSLRSMHLAQRGDTGRRPGDLFAASAYAQYAEGEALFGPAPGSPLPAAHGPAEGGGSGERARLREKYALRPEQEEVLGRMMRGVWERLGGAPSGGAGQAGERGNDEGWPRAPPSEAADASERDPAFSLPASPPSTHSAKSGGRAGHSLALSSVASSYGAGDKAWADDRAAVLPPPPRTPFPTTTPLDSPPLRSTPAESPRSTYRSRPASPFSRPASASPPASPPRGVADRTLTPMPSPPTALTGAQGFPFAERARPVLFRSLGWAYLPARSGARTQRAPLVDAELGEEEREWVLRTARVPDDGGLRDWWGNPVGMGGDWGRAVLSPIVTETEPTHSSPALSGRSAASYLLRSPHFASQQQRSTSVPPLSVVGTDASSSPGRSDRSVRSSRASGIASASANGVALPPPRRQEDTPVDNTSRATSSMASGEHFADSTRSRASTPARPSTSSNQVHSFALPSRHSDGSSILPRGIAYDPSIPPEDYAHAPPSPPREESFFLGSGRSSATPSSRHTSHFGAPDERLSGDPSSGVGSLATSRRQEEAPVDNTSRAMPSMASGEHFAVSTRSRASPPARPSTSSNQVHSFASPSRSSNGSAILPRGIAYDPSIPPEDYAHAPPSPLREESFFLGSGRLSATPSSGGASQSVAPDERLSTIPTSGIGSLASQTEERPASTARSTLGLSRAPSSTVAHGDALDTQPATPSRASRAPSSDSPVSLASYSTAVAHPSSPPFTSPRNGSLFTSTGEGALSSAVAHPSSPPFTAPRNDSSSTFVGQGALSGARSPSSIGPEARGAPGSWPVDAGPATERTGTPSALLASSITSAGGIPTGGSSLSPSGATNSPRDEISQWVSGVPIGAGEEPSEVALSSSTERANGSNGSSITEQREGRATPTVRPTDASSTIDRTFSSAFSPSRTSLRSPPKSSLSSHSPRSSNRAIGVFSPGVVPPTPSEYVSASERFSSVPDLALSSSPLGFDGATTESLRSAPSSPFYRGETDSRLDAVSPSSRTSKQRTPASYMSIGALQSSLDEPSVAQESPLFGTGSPMSTPPRLSPIPRFRFSNYSSSHGVLGGDVAHPRTPPRRPRSSASVPTARVPSSSTSTAGPDLAGAGGQLSLDSLSTTPRSPPLVPTQLTSSHSPSKASSFSTRRPPPSPLLSDIHEAELSSHSPAYTHSPGPATPTLFSPGEAALDHIPAPGFSPASPPSPTPPSPSAYSSSGARVLSQRYVPRPPIKPPRRGPGPFPVPQLSEEEKQARRELRRLGKSPEWDVPIEETKAGRRKRAWSEMQAFEKERARLFKLLGDPMTEQDVPVLNALAQLYLDSSNPAVREQAAQFLQNSLQLNDAQPDIARLLALELEDVDIEEALVWHRHAVEQGSDDPERHLSLGHCLLRAGNPAEASHVFLNVARSFTDDPYEAIALYELGRLYQQHGGAEERTHALEAFESALACLTRLKLEPPDVRLGERWDELDLVERAVIRGLREVREGRKSLFESPFSSRQATPRGPLSPVSPLTAHFPPAPRQHAPPTGTTPPPLPAKPALRPSTQVSAAFDERIHSGPPSRSPTVLNEALPAKHALRSPHERRRNRRKVDPETARTLDTILSSLTRLSRSSPAADLAKSTRALAAQVERTYAGLRHSSGAEAAQHDELFRTLDEVQRELCTLPDRLVSSAKLVAARPPGAPPPPTAHDPLEDARRKLERARQLIP